MKGRAGSPSGSLRAGAAAGAGAGHGGVAAAVAAAWPPRPAPGLPAPEPPSVRARAPRAHRLVPRTPDPPTLGAPRIRPSLSQAKPHTPNPLFEAPRIGSTPMSEVCLAAEPSRLWKLRH